MRVLSLDELDYVSGGDGWDDFSDLGGGDFGDGGWGDGGWGDGGDGGDGGQEYALSAAPPKTPPDPNSVLKWLENLWNQLTQPQQQPTPQQLQAMWNSCIQSGGTPIYGGSSQNAQAGPFSWGSSNAGIACIHKQ